MALRLWALALLGLAGAGAALQPPRKLDSFRSETDLNHLAVDEASGTVYLGAVNALYQLSADLRLEQQAATGPALDHKKCTPPIEASQCHEAEPTDNVNQLLLLDPPGLRLIECGSLFKGICALRSLGNVSVRLFYEDSSGERSFVASNDESVATVGLVSAPQPGRERLLFVGKGNGLYDNGAIVSTRLLDRAGGREAFEAYSDQATYKAGYMSSNTQQFVAAFEDGLYVFFVFNQHDKHPPQNRTLVARLCKDDPYYYSYLEMDLRCLDPGDGDGRVAAFSTCLAASVATSGAGRVLYAVFTRDEQKGGGPRAGLCLFPLTQVNAKMQANRNACYTGHSKASHDTFYKPFHGDIQCGGHGPVRGLSSFPAGPGLHVAAACWRVPALAGVGGPREGRTWAGSQEWGRHVQGPCSWRPARGQKSAGRRGGERLRQVGGVRAHSRRLGPQDASQSFPCGSEHLPYPLGSREGLTATAVLQRGGLNLTAVTVATENGHTIAFLGTSDGQVLKVRPGVGTGRGPEGLPPREGRPHAAARAPAGVPGAGRQLRGVRLHPRGDQQEDQAGPGAVCRPGQSVRHDPGQGGPRGPGGAACRLGHCDRPGGADKDQEGPTLLSLGSWQRLRPCL